MTQLEWSQPPPTRDETSRGPVMVVAFEGWSDAGDAATAAVEHLWQRWEATTIASIDPEDFYDFTSTRPTARIDDDGHRTVDWPANEFGWARPDGTDGVLLVRGVEPHLRWRTFTSLLLDVAATVECSLVVTLGALLSDVPHTRPTPVFVNAQDRRLMPRADDAPVIEQSDYEGPTGILGVLHGECARFGLPSISAWAVVPAYAPSSPSPKAAIALVDQISELLHVGIDTSALDLATVSYERQLDELIAEDDDTVDYVRHLEQAHDTLAAETDGVEVGLVDEVERFLRDQ